MAIEKTSLTGLTKWTDPDYGDPFHVDQFNEDAEALDDFLGRGGLQFDIRAYGAVGDGETDDVAAIQATIDAAQAAGGGVVFLPAGTYAIGSVRISVPRGVDLLGSSRGNYDAGGYGATTLLCTHADAGVSFSTRTQGGHRGGYSGRFEIYGNGIATQPFYVGLMSDRTFELIRVDNAAGTGVLIESTQNCEFRKVSSVDCTGPGMVLDSGAGGNVFTACNTSRCGGPGVPSFLMDESYGDVGYAGVGPSHNTFIGCIFERPNSGQDVEVSLRSGRGNAFFGCVFVSGDADVPCVTLDLNTPPTLGGALVTGNTRIYGCTFSGSTTYTTAIVFGNGHTMTHLDRCLIIGALVGLSVLSTLAVELGPITFNQVTTEVSGASESTALRQRLIGTTQMTRWAAADTIIQGIVRGDAGIRFRVRADGQIGWGPGTGFSPDVTLFRHTPTQLRTGVEFVADGGVRIGSGAGSSPKWSQGTGSPEGVVAAYPGSLYSRIDGGAGTCLYVKESGTGTAGWVAK